MKKFLSGSAIPAGVVVAGLMAGYWHFADLMPRRESEERALAGGRQTSPEPHVEPAKTEAEGAASLASPQPEAPLAPPPDQPEPNETEEEVLPSLGAAADTPADAGAVEEEAPAVAAKPTEDATTAEEAIPESDGVPSFGLLRVEPDGSAVVAGQATPGSEVLLRSENSIIARDTSGPTGDFAMTLNAPLAVGDHSLRLEATAPGGSSLTSPEVAIISIPPRGSEEELLVAVEAPDTPTRLVNVPTAAAEVPAQEPAEDAPASPAAPSAQEETEMATELATVAPEPKAQPEATVEEEGLGSGLDEEGALAEEAPAAEPDLTSEPGPAPNSNLAIAAVEIEDDRIYIAGTSKPGATIRLYLDGALIAETGSGAGEQFIAEATADVSVGPHVVRADELGADGSVVARVEVPFDRPPGTSMAALAPEVQEPEPAPEPLVQPQAPKPVEAEPEREQAEVPVVVAAAPDDREEDEERATPAPPAPEEPVTAAASPLSTRAASAPSEDPAGEATAPRADAAPVSEPLPSTVERRPPPPAIPAEEPAQVGAAGEGALKRSDSTAEDAPAATGLGERQETREVIPAEIASVEPMPPVGDPVPAQATARMQAALEPVDGRVIIRRGDTLWRISRNAYGLGSRYTVIYLANGNQIRDPDLIYPGQVFRMPGGRQAHGRSVLR